jgi:hypothetical protein
MKFFCSFLICLLFAVTTAAQSATGRIAGTVLDATGAVVEGATVTATNDGTKVSFNTVTSDAGKYTFEALQPGTYTVVVEQVNFKRYSTSANVVTANDTTNINVPLEAGSVTETVEVSATFERIQTSQSGNFGNTLNERALQELPVLNRNPLFLIAIQPGVVQGTNSAGSGTNIFGSRDRAFNITLDGIDMNETSAGSATGDSTPVRPNVDSISEYRVITSNPSAEFGRNSGAQISLTTKSGTNRFSGNLFEFHRNRVLNANEFSLNRLGIERRFLLRNQFGGSIGGPIYLPRFGEGGPGYYSGKNRTFFFFNTQIQRQTQTREQVSTVYTAQARQGIFRYGTSGQNRPFNAAGASVDAQGNPVVPLASPYNVFDPRGLGFDPTVMSIINLTPLPNTFEFGDGLNTAGFRSLATRTDPQNDYAFRLDHSFSETQNMFGRFNSGKFSTVGDTTNAGAARFPGLPPIVSTFRNSKNIAVGLRSTLSPQATNELIVGGNRFIFDFAVPSNQDPRTTPFVLATITNPLANSFGNKRTINTFQVLDNVSIVRGAHTFRFGTNLRLQQHYDIRGSIGGTDANPQYLIGNTPNSATFRIPTNINTNDLATAQGLINNLLGRLASGNVGLTAVDNAYAPPGTGFSFDAWYPEGDFYIQDDWKVRPNLTLNVGLRWEPKPKPYTRGSSVILVPDRLVTLEGSPANNISFVEGDLYKSDWNNFGPAIGVAYDPFGDGRTVLRGNFRIAFDRISTFLPSSAIFPNAPGTTTRQEFTVAQNEDRRIRDGLPSLLAPAGVTPTARRTPLSPGLGQSLEVIDPNFETPTTYMFSAGVQRDLGKGFVVQAEYVGRAGRNLIGGYERNQVDIFDNGFLDAFNRAQGGDTTGLLDRLTAPARAANQSTIAYLRANFAATLGAASTTQQLGNRNNVAALAASLNNLTICVGGTGTACTGGTRPRLPVAAGLGESFFNDFPQFLGGLQVIDSNSFSNYHAGVFQVSRRFAKGLQFDMSYVFSKSLDDKSFDPVFTRVGAGNTQSGQSTPFDPEDRSLNYGISDFDRTHVLQGNVLYELPFGRNKRFLSDSNGFVSRLVGGFTFSTTLVYQSGLPFTIVAGNNTFSNRISSRVNYSGDRYTLRYTLDPQTGVRSLFTPEQIGQFSNPSAGEIGNTPRNAFRLPPQFNMDAALIKAHPNHGAHELRVACRDFQPDQHALLRLPGTATCRVSLPQASATSGA